MGGLDYSIIFILILRTPSSVCLSYLVAHLLREELGWIGSDGIGLDWVLSDRIPFTKRFSLVILYDPLTSMKTSDSTLFIEDIKIPFSQISQPPSQLFSPSLERGKINTSRLSLVPL
uniref:Uncharacterized protein n=1 Tax=Austropuccinia psidii TaxID=181123 RepID=A0A513X017_9BASI|nr:hypothetical protein [Austropuccinia psidii]QDH07276.1 hypothetical protein [Austropuccinia psidii]